jgi:hypothetical protein|tara:strand:- start:1096 stop:1272 length:177 start_codon:yes stop_codon:yes gene_type:complete
METQKITIIIQSDIDQSTLLDIVNELSENLVEEIETYGEEADLIESETSVESIDMLTN